MARRDDHAYLHRLGVLPTHRRRGLAKALIAHVESQAREGGSTRMRLGVRLTLEAERAYYERLGYAFHSHGYHEGRAEPTFAYLEKAL